MADLKKIGDYRFYLEHAIQLGSTVKIINALHSSWKVVINPILENALLNDSLLKNVFVVRDDSGKEKVYRIMNSDFPDVNSNVFPDYSPELLFLRRITEASDLTALYFELQNGSKARYVAYGNFIVQEGKLIPNSIYNLNDTGFLFSRYLYV